MSPCILFEENLFSPLLTYLYPNDFKSSPGGPLGTKPPSVWGMSYFSTPNSAPLPGSPPPPPRLLSRAPLLWKSASALAVPSLLRCQILLVFPFASVPFAFHCYYPFQSFPRTVFLVGLGKPPNWCPCLWFLLCVSSPSPHELPQEHTPHLQPRYVNVQIPSMSPTGSYIHISQLDIQDQYYSALNVLQFYFPLNACTNQF